MSIPRQPAQLLSLCANPKVKNPPVHLKLTTTFVFSVNTDKDKNRPNASQGEPHSKKMNTCMIIWGSFGSTKKGKTK